MRKLLLILTLLGVGCGDPEEQSRILYRAAMDAVENKEPLEAEHLLTRIENDYSDTVIATKAIETLRDYQKVLEESAIEALGTIHAGQGVFFGTKGRYAFSVQELIAANLAEPVLGSVTVTGYRYRFVVESGRSGYSIEAIPIMNPETKRHFYTDVSGIISEERGEPATERSPEV